MWVRYGLTYAASRNAASFSGCAHGVAKAMAAPRPTPSNTIAFTISDPTNRPPRNAVLLTGVVYSSGSIPAS
jgi:hypothetical protein